jgi:thiol-disulfide isomerase/thioredoxin
MLLASLLVPLALVAAPSPAEGPAVTEARAAFYRRAFPEATQFALKRFPSEAIPTEDRGNETYVEARDAEGALVGYLRDFEGPITITMTCPCHELSLTMAFDDDLKLTTIISEAPVEKYGHAPMTSEDMARLVEIVGSPPEALLKAPRPDDVVDAVTGATRTEYKEMVVHQAALTTRRLAGLVKDTVRLISGAPLARDRQALNALLEGKTNPREIVTILANFIPRAESDELRAQVFDTLIHYYSEALGHGSIRLPSVESQLLGSADAHPQDLARACQYLASRSQALDLVQDCIRRLAPHAAEVDAGLWALLKGTEAFENGRTAEAVPALEAAADAVSPSVDPALHLRLVQALSAVGRKSDGCRRVKTLLREEPLFPGALTWLSLCPEPDDVLIAAQRKERREELLKQRRSDDTPLPPLALTDDQGRATKLDLAREGKAYILIFFAAWCPHCQADFPVFKEVAESVQADPSLRERVRVLGVRTYAARDTEPWADFARRFAPNFPVWSDAPEGDTLKSLAASFGFSAGIPRLLVVDEKGVLRFMIDADPYHEMAREILWAAEAVIGADH